MDRAEFDNDVTRRAKASGVTLSAAIKKAIFAALGERDPEAEICRDRNGKPEPDGELRDTKNIPLPLDAQPPSIETCRDQALTEALNDRFGDTIEDYLRAEVLPHVPDAWVDRSKTKIGYEIPINRHFSVYKPPRPLEEIKADIGSLEGEIAGLLKGLVQ